MTLMRQMDVVPPRPAFGARRIEPGSADDDGQDLTALTRPDVCASATRSVDSAVRLIVGNKPEHGGVGGSIVHHA
jgi:hypothetical protein